MTRRYHLAAALAAVLGAGPALAQFDVPVGGRPAGSPETPGALPDPKPVYKYELKPEHADYLVFVRAYQASRAADPTGQARELAEGLAEWIRSECRLYAFVHERGWLQRRQRDQEKAAVIKAIRDSETARGKTEEEIAARIKREVKLARIPDEYVVFVAPGKGTLKTWDEAAEFAKYVHKLACPPAQFCDSVFVGSERDVSRRPGERSNPFEKAMPGWNPTRPKPVAAERAKADGVLEGLNAGQPYSLIHKTKKPITLVVQTYGGKLGQVYKAGDVTQASGKADGELLERAAQQANALAQVLRKQDPSYDAYVLHTRFESYVCVGEFDSKDDPELLAIAKRLAGRPFQDKKTGQVIETLMEKPLPALIPRS